LKLAQEKISSVSGKRIIKSSQNNQFNAMHIIKKINLTPFDRIRRLLKELIEKKNSWQRC